MYAPAGVPDMSGVDSWLQQLLGQHYGPPVVNDAVDPRQVAAAQRAAVLAQLQASVAPLAAAVAAGQQVGFQGQLPVNYQAPSRRPTSGRRPGRFSSKQATARLAALARALGGGNDGWSRAQSPGDGWSVVQPPSDGFAQVRPQAARAAWSRVHTKFPWMLAG